MNIVSLVLLVVFGISVLVTYLLVRRSQIKVVPAAVIGSVFDVIIFGLYSLSAGNPPIQAILVGLILGIVFNVVTVVAASYFRESELAH